MRIPKGQNCFILESANTKTGVSAQKVVTFEEVWKAKMKTRWLLGFNDIDLLNGSKEGLVKVGYDEDEKHTILAYNRWDFDPGGNGVQSGFFFALDDNGNVSFRLFRLG